MAQSGLEGGAAPAARPRLSYSGPAVAASHRGACLRATTTLAVPGPQRARANLDTAAQPRGPRGGGGGRHPQARQPSHPAPQLRDAPAGADVDIRVIQVLLGHAKLDTLAGGARMSASTSFGSCRRSRPAARPRWAAMSRAAGTAATPASPATAAGTGTAPSARERRRASGWRHVRPTCSRSMPALTRLHDRRRPASENLHQLSPFSWLIRVLRSGDIK